MPKTKTPVCARSILIGHDNNLNLNSVGPTIIDGSDSTFLQVPIFMSYPFPPSLAEHIDTMEPEKGTGRQPESEPEHLVRTCSSLLRHRHFTRCREFARRVPRSDPTISDSVDRILAIADVLHAAERRLNNNHFDWYAILQLPRVNSGNRPLIRSQFKRFLHLLNPNRNGFAFSNEAFMLVRDAWLVLSDPRKRAQYEQEIHNSPPHEVRKQSGDKQDSSRDVPGNGHNVNVDEPKLTFWTVCPYCWFLYEYEKIYEECCLRCQKCRRAFHGVAVKPPGPEMLVMGKEKYYCYSAHVPLRYPASLHSTVDKDSKNKNVRAFACIPDDGDGDSSKNCGIGEQERVFRAEQAGIEGLHGELRKNVGEGIKGNPSYEECEPKASGRTEFQSNGKRRMRVKTVARNTKKITGNRRRCQGHISPNRDAELSDLDAEDGD